MSPEEIKAYFADPDRNLGPVPDIQLEWTPELLMKAEKMLRDKNYAEDRINRLIENFRIQAEDQRRAKEQR